MLGNDGKFEEFENENLSNGIFAEKPIFLNTDLDMLIMLESIAM